MKPVIIISADWREEAGGAIELGNWYVSAVIQAGGIPWRHPRQRISTTSKAPPATY